MRWIERNLPDEVLEDKRYYLKTICFMISNMLAVFIILFTLLPTGMRSVGNDILRLNIPKEPTLDPNTVCKTYPELSSAQYVLCSDYPDVTASAIQGVQIAIYECQYQLKDHRWNCSTLERKNKNPHKNPILGRGYKETAFAYALSAAGVTHQVAKACSLGKLRSCGCDMRKFGKTEADWEWGGCSHNIDYGEKFAKKFLDSKRSRDVQAKIGMHNRRAGRLAVTRNVKKTCKCHGMSGSCEVMTCWKAAPDFRFVGDFLGKKFLSAKKIRVLNAARGKFLSRRDKRPRRTELIFYEKSPNFCEPNPLLESPGTSGRLCNKSSNGADDCDTMCCGRGYDTLRVRRKERCDCKFHWCCYVVCKECVYNEWVTVCK